MTQTSSDHTADTLVINLTFPAAARIKRVIDENGLPETAGLRAGATDGGCSGLNYLVEIQEAPAPDDVVLVVSGVRVFVNAFSAPHVNGMTIDWKSSMQESRFVFENPNATGGCGCGVSFTTS